MEIVNATPFVPLAFKFLDMEGDHHHVLVLRGTFDFPTANGGPLTVADEQDPLVTADRYAGEPGLSSLVWETDVTPFKPSADILVNAVAHPPDGLPVDSWEAAVRVGQTEKRVRVTGPRWWRYSRWSGWNLSEPEPCKAVPLKYELAYGGSVERDGKVARFDPNPVGVGFVKESWLRDQEPIPAPQIEMVDQPVSRIDQAYVPAGLSPVPKTWPPRRNLCGTADDAWARDRWPLLPIDFDWRYFNAAPDGLVYPDYLNGDEPVELRGLDPSGDIRFRLPGRRVAAVVTDEDDFTCAVRLHLDTLGLDVPRRRAYLVWRGNLLDQGSLTKVTFAFLRPGAPSHG